MATRKIRTPQEIVDLFYYERRRRKFKAKRQAALKENQKWDLDFEDVVWPEYCPVLNIPLDYCTAVVSDNSPSFDRIDNSKGYIKGNVSIISARANRIKNAGTKAELEQILKYLTKHL